MIANELEYEALYENIDWTSEDVVAAKCNCTACNSCSCGRCSRCVSQCTGCRGIYTAEELDWEAA